MEHPENKPGLAAPHSRGSVVGTTGPPAKKLYVLGPWEARLLKGGRGMRLIAH